MIAYRLGSSAKQSVYAITPPVLRSSPAWYRPAGLGAVAEPRSARFFCSRGKATPQFSDSQLVVLTAACQRPDRSVFPVTARLKKLGLDVTSEKDEKRGRVYR
ncbi:MAG: hypothetical protein ACXW3N_13805, partial [Rhodoplanes sp.]